MAAGGERRCCCRTDRPRLRRRSTWAPTSVYRRQCRRRSRCWDATAKLHALAKLAQQHNVITVIGTGGMGKTALAAAYARRFGLRYRDGVLRYSFAAGEVDDGDFPARSAPNDWWAMPWPTKAPEQRGADDFRRTSPPRAAAAGRQFRDACNQADDGPTIRSTQRRRQFDLLAKIAQQRRIFRLPAAASRLD